MSSKEDEEKLIKEFKYFVFIPNRNQFLPSFDIFFNRFRSGFLYNFVIFFFAIEWFFGYNIIYFV